MSMDGIIRMVINGFLWGILFVVVSVGVIYFHKKKSNKSFSKPTRTFVFLLYMFILIYITVFRGSFFLYPQHSINIIPFNELLNAAHYQVEVWDTTSATLILLYNVFGNIICFIPFGLLLCTISNEMNFKKTLLYSTLLSLSIEVCQYIFYTGISDIDDIIFNVLGGIIGFYIYKRIRIRKEKNREKVRL